VTDYQGENKLKKLNGIREEESQSYLQADSIIIMDNGMPNDSSEQKKKEEARPFVVVGSNNIIGHNIFLVNTNSEQENLESLIKALPSEFLEKLMMAMGSVIQKQTNNQDN